MIRYIEKIAKIFIYIILFAVLQILDTESLYYPYHIPKSQTKQGILLHLFMK